MENEKPAEISSLSPQKKMCLQMVQGTDLGISEISARCGLSRSTVYKTVKESLGEDFLRRRTEGASAAKAHEGAMSLLRGEGDPVTVIDLPQPAAAEPQPVPAAPPVAGTGVLTQKQARIYGLIDDLARGGTGKSEGRFPYAEIIRRYREETGDYVCEDTVYRVRKLWLAAQGTSSGTALAESIADRLVNPGDLFVLSGESRRKGLRNKKQINRIC